MPHRVLDPRPRRHELRVYRQWLRVHSHLLDNAMSEPEAEAYSSLVAKAGVERVYYERKEQRGADEVDRTST